MRTALIVAMALVAAPAAAQTTTCGEEWGKWVCRTQPARPSNLISDYNFTDVGERSNRAYESMMRMRADRERMEAGVAKQAPPSPAPVDNGVSASKLIAEGQIVLRQAEVAALLREGRCEDAKMRALADSDIDLADKAARICGAR